MYNLYMPGVRKQFEYYKQLGDKSLAQLEEAQLFWRPDTQANSIAIIVGHLNGNMLSRWTNFLAEDGEKAWRQREQEFEPVINSKEQLLEKWEEGWACLFSAIDLVNDENFDSKVYIRNQAHSIVDAFNRQMMHYAYHIGQLVWIGRMQKGTAWESLSIPRGGSAAFNQSKFERGKHKGSFTDDFK